MKVTDPSDPKQLKQMRIWRHNSYRGHAVMMKKQLTAIINAETTTEQTKSTARAIFGAVSCLEVYLQTRVDP